MCVLCFILFHTHHSFPYNTLTPSRPPLTFPGNTRLPRGKNVKKCFFLTISHTPCQHTLHHTLTTLPSLCIRNQPPFTLRKTEKMRIFSISLFSEFFFRQLIWLTYFLVRELHQKSAYSSKTCFELY